MAAKKTTGIKARTKPRRARSKRKIILHTPPKPDSASATVQEERPASRPRKRNALGAERVARIVLKDTPGSEETREFQSVSFHKARHWKKPADFDAPWFQSSRDRPTPEDTRRNRARMLQAMLVATLMLGIFNSNALVSWVRGLPAGPVEDRIIFLAETWNDWMDAGGLSDYMADLRTYVRSLKEKRWQDF